MAMGWGMDQGPNPKPLKDCKYCEGKGYVEDYHKSEYQTCNCQQMKAYDRKCAVRRAKERYKEAKAEMKRLRLKLS